MLYCWPQNKTIFVYLVYMKFLTLKRDRKQSHHFTPTGPDAYKIVSKMNAEQYFIFYIFIFNFVQELIPLILPNAVFILF